MLDLVSFLFLRSLFDLTILEFLPYRASLCTFLYPFMGSLVDAEVATSYSTELKS